MSELAAWILSTGSFAAIVLLTALAAKAFAGDAARGRRRCPRCWHELGPAPADSASEDAARRARHCGECGFTAEIERHTLRTRRRIGVGVLAVVGILAIVAAARVRFLDQGVWSILPTRLLLVASPYVGNGGYQSVQAELAKRINALQLDRELLADTVDLVVEHARSGPPETAAWNGLYFQVSSALMRAIPPDDPMLLRFLEVPPTFLVSFLGAREGRPHLLGIDALEWWPAGVDAKLVVEFADGTVRQARFNPASQSNQLLVEMPAAVNAGDKVRLVLSVRAGGAGDDAWRDYPAAYTQIPEMLGRGPTEPDAKPIDSPELRAAVTSVFYPDHELVVWADGTPRAGLQFSNAPATGPEMASILFGLRVEIREGDAVRRTSRIWWAGVGGASRVRWLPPIEDIESLARLAAQDPALDANWTVRITGDPDLADYARPPVAEFPARSDFRYWSGSIEFPLKVLRAGGSSPLRRWTPVDP